MRRRKLPGRRTGRSRYADRPLPKLLIGFLFTKSAARCGYENSLDAELGVRGMLIGLYHNSWLGSYSQKVRPGAETENSLDAELGVRGMLTGLYQNSWLGSYSQKVRPGAETENSVNAELGVRGMLTGLYQNSWLGSYSQKVRPGAETNTPWTPNWAFAVC